MAQEETIYIGKGDSPSTMQKKLDRGIRNAQTKASHARNVEASRAAAESEARYFGGGDMSGGRDTTGGEVADRLTREAARLPVRDAEDTARAQAREAGGYRKSTRRSTRR